MDEERLRPGWDTYFMASSSHLAYNVESYILTMWIDIGIVSFPPVELYETSCGGSARSIKENLIDWV
jgi:hypothetical protein